MCDERWTEPIEYVPRPRRVRSRLKCEPAPETLVSAAEIEAFAREKLGAPKQDREEAR